MSIEFPTYSKINSIQKRHTEGPKKGQFTGGWALPEFEYLADNEWVWREKVDGTNIRIQLGGGLPGGHRIGGRTDNAQIPSPLLVRLQSLMGTLVYDGTIGDTFDLDSLIRGSIILFGEGYGTGIQKGGGAYGDPDFILFDVRIDNTWLREDDITGIAAALGIDRVPLMGTGTLNEAIDVVRNRKIVSTWEGVEIEGLVCTPTIPLFDRRGKRIITKVKGCDFK
jgi:hypothetical protein